MSWLRRLVAGRSSWRPYFSPRTVHMVEKVELGLAFSPSTSAFCCQYHSTDVPCSVIHLLPTLYDVRNWRLLYVMHKSTSTNNVVYDRIAKVFQIRVLNDTWPFYNSLSGKDFYVHILEIFCVGWFTCGDPSPF